jgi:hypothetical protein
MTVNRCQIAISELTVNYVTRKPKIIKVIYYKIGLNPSWMVIDYCNRKLSDTQGCH